MSTRKKTLFIAVFLILSSTQLFSTTYTWNSWVAGALTYNATNLSAVVTSTNFDTRGPQDPNGGTSNGYKSPKYVSAATINTYQGGFTNDYGMPGLVLGLDWPNLTSSTTLTITFATPIAGPVSFNIYDINTGSWGGNNPVWVDKITLAGTNCSGALVYPVISGCGNNVSGANNNVITGNLGCTNNTNTITFNSPTLKTITLTYASGGPLSSGYGSDPDPEYIIISDITASNTSLVGVISNAGITCASPSVALNGSSSISGAQFSWTGPNSGSPAGTSPTSASTTISSAGTYVLAVTDPSTGCVFRDTVSVNQNNTAPGANIAPPSNLGCSVSSVTLSASSSTGNVTYSWSGGGTGATKTVTATGTYTVTVTDPANGCTSTASEVVSSTGNPLSVNATFVAASCGNNNGSATANVTAGTATGYSWNNGANTQTASNLVAGTYTVTVTGAGGCTATASTTVTSTAGLQLSTTSTNTTCGNNNGIAIVNVTTGTATGYNWSSGANTQTAANLAAGTYTVTVTGAGGCTATASAAVTSSTGIVISTATTNATCGNNNGTAVVNVITGTANSYSWSSGATAQTAGNLGAGTYTVTVTGAGGCTATASASVTSTTGIVISTTTTNATCGNNNGTAVVNVTTGTASSYNWSSGASTQTAGNLAAGTYTVTVTGTGGCSATSSATITSTTGIAVSTYSNAATCGNNNGNATVNITMGTATGYNWSSGANTQTASNLSGGTYTVTVTGTGGCTATASITVASTAAITITTSVVNTTCGNSNGSATVAVTSGTAIGYNWSNGGNTDSIFNLATGSYTVTVTGSGGCSASASVTVNPSGANAVTVFSDKTIMCSGDSARVCAPSGYSAYQWNTGATTECLYTSLAGNYYVTVTDAGGCTATSNHLAINVHPQPPVSISVNGDTLLSYNSLTYQWYFNGGIILNATSPLLIANQSGYYTVLVSDTNGCTALSLPVEVTVTGISDITRDGLVVYPNPSQNGVWDLDCGSNFKGGTIEIFDDNVRLVYKSKIQSQKERIEWGASEGIYMMKISSGAKILALKLIKL